MSSVGLGLPEIEPASGVEVCFEGRLSLSVCKIPMGSLVDLSARGTHTVYLCCWIGGREGKSCDVTFPADGKGVGSFKFTLRCRLDDPDALMVQATMRMRDQDTNNLRTIPLCSSFARVGVMLQGGDDSFRLRHPFMAGEFADVVMRISNAKDFRNHPASASMTAKPLFALRASSVDRITELNQVLTNVSRGLQSDVQQNKATVPRDVDTMLDGLSRYPPSASSVALFVSLMLGTPAYALVVVQPGVRGPVRRGHG